MDASIHPFSVPLVRPLETADGRIDERSGALIRLEAGDVVGWGEATPLAGWTESVADCRTALERAIDRLERERPESLLDDLRDTPAARHGVHLALADLDARRAGEPLYRSIGGDHQVDSIPVNATIGDGDVAATVTAAESAAADGFRCLKVKVGGRPVPEDVHRLRAVRDALGGDVSLRADANGAWSPTEADEAFSRLAEVGVEYVEQPLAPDDLEGHAALRGGRVGVAVDETLRDHAPDVVLTAGAADALVLKPMVLGGLDRARAVARSALEAGVQPVVSNTIDAVVARTGAVHLAASLSDPAPAGLATAGWLAGDLAADPAPVRDGRAAVPDRPGLGLDVEEPP